MTRKVDLTAMSVPRAKKGEAVPMSSAPAAELRPEPAVPAAPPPALPQTQPSPPRIAPSEAPAPPIVPRKARERGEPRSPVTTRLTYSVQDRLFRAATVLGQSQQALIEEAIDDLLRKHGL